MEYKKQKTTVEVIWDRRIPFMKHHLDVAPLLRQNSDVLSATTIFTSGGNV